MSDHDPVARPDAHRPRQGGLLQTFKAVGWAFIGIRKRAGYEHDVAQLKPAQVIVAGLVAAALFVVALVVLVHWIVGDPGAA